MRKRNTRGTAGIIILICTINIFIKERCAIFVRRFLIVLMFILQVYSAINIFVLLNFNFCKEMIFCGNLSVVMGGRICYTDNASFFKEEKKK